MEKKSGRPSVQKTSRVEMRLGVCKLWFSRDQMDWNENWVQGSRKKQRAGHGLVALLADGNAAGEAFCRAATLARCSSTPTSYRTTFEERIEAAFALNTKWAVISSFG